MLLHRKEVNQERHGPMLIGQLAKSAGVKSDSIRFYERTGLLPKAQRSPGGYRVYDPAVLRQLRFIKQAQALGFSLDEVKRILTLRGQGKQTCQCVMRIAEATLSETEEKLRELQQFHDTLKQAVTDWKHSAARRRKCPAEFCDLIEKTNIPAAAVQRPKLGVLEQAAPHAGMEEKSRELTEEGSEPGSKG